MSQCHTENTKSIKLKGNPSVICSFQTEQILKKMQTKSRHKFNDWNEKTKEKALDPSLLKTDNENNRKEKWILLVELSLELEL
jgi:hypothetical protein